MNEAHMCDSEIKHSVIWTKHLIGMTVRGTWAPRRTLTNDDECPCLLSFRPPHPYFILLSPPFLRPTRHRLRETFRGPTQRPAKHCGSQCSPLCSESSRTPVPLLHWFPTCLENHHKSNPGTRMHTQRLTSHTLISAQANTITCKCKLISVCVLSTLSCFIYTELEERID